jgi:alpha-glucosidase
MADGPGGTPPLDRFGRDAFRHPMQWEPGPDGGFGTAEAWLPIVDPEARNVAAQRSDPGSLLSLYRELIRVRRGLDGPLQSAEARGGVVELRRGRHRVRINVDGDAGAPLGDGEVVVATAPQAAAAGLLGPGEGALLRDG